MGRIFTNSIIPGKAIGAQKGLARDLTLVMDILENIAGIGDITINKNGRDWRITSTASGSSSGGIPAGYEEETLNIITDAGIVTRKVLVETATKASVETFASADSRLLLAITTGGVVRKSKGYLKA